MWIPVPGVLHSENLEWTNDDRTNLIFLFKKDDTRTTVFDWRWGHFTFIFLSQFIDSVKRINAKRKRKKWWNHSDLQFMSVAASNCFISVQFISRVSHMSVYCRLIYELKIECKRFIQETSRFEFGIDRTFHKKIRATYKKIWRNIENEH